MSASTGNNPQPNKKEFLVEELHNSRLLYQSYGPYFKILLWDQPAWAC